MTTGRILLDVELQPALGSRFQPTGFPDLGHAEFQRPGGAPSLLVESEQSMANHLEGTAWDDVSNDQSGVLAGLPYVRVVNGDGAFITSSRTEAHRLASAFVKDSTLDGVSMVDEIRQRLNLQTDTPLDHRHIAREIFRLDPFALLHGVFFADSKWPGQPKIARAITSFIEAENVLRAESGGVKKDHVRHSIAEGSGGSSEGYGTVPFARTAWTAERIVASFGIDTKQIASYGLGDDASVLLETIALWEIRSLLDGGLRLRTACDFISTSAEIVDKEGRALPSAEELATQIIASVTNCSELLAGSDVIEVVWDGGAKKSKKATA